LVYSQDWRKTIKLYSMVLESLLTGAWKGFSILFYEKNRGISVSVWSENGFATYGISYMSRWASKVISYSDNLATRFWAHFKWASHFEEMVPVVMEHTIGVHTVNYLWFFLLFEFCTVAPSGACQTNITPGKNLA